jgi:hypothetical protein
VSELQRTRRADSSPLSYHYRRRRPDFFAAFFAGFLAAFFLTTRFAFDGGG